MTPNVRPMTLPETGLIIEYFHTAAPEHLETMGVDPTRLPAREAWRERFADDFARPIEQRQAETAADGIADRVADHRADNRGRADADRIDRQLVP